MNSTTTDKEIRSILEKYDKRLRLVPEKFRTPEMYYMAVKSNRRSLALVPEKFRTPEMIKLRTKG